jgi:hypothetical protein
LLVTEHVRYRTGYLTGSAEREKRKEKISDVRESGGGGEVAGNGAELHVVRKNV